MPVVGRKRGKSLVRFHQLFSSSLQDEEAKFIPGPGEWSEEGSKRARLAASASAVVVRALYDFLYPLVVYILRVPVPLQ